MNVKYIYKKYKIYLDRKMKILCIKKKEYKEM